VSWWTIGGQNPVETGGNLGQNRLTQSPCLDRFAGKKPAHQFNGGLLAIQKVEGSSPFSGFEERPAATAFGAFQLAPRIGLGCRERLLV
jgi:hypothetical protein